MRNTNLIQEGISEVEQIEKTTNGVTGKIEIETKSPQKLSHRIWEMVESFKT